MAKDVTLTDPKNNDESIYPRTYTRNVYNEGGNKDVNQLLEEKVTKNITVNSANEAVDNSFYHITAGDNLNPFKTDEHNQDYRILTTGYNSNYLQQIATNYHDGRMFYRIKNNDNWTDWEQIAKKEDIPLLLLTGTQDNPILIYDLEPGNYNITDNSYVCFSQDNIQYKFVGKVFIEVSQKYAYKNELSGIWTDFYNITGIFYYAASSNISGVGLDHSITYRIAVNNSTNYEIVEHHIVDKELNLDSPNAIQNGIVSRMMSKLIPIGDFIESQSNLNETSYLKVGTYCCSSDSCASTLVNSPTHFAFMMNVYNPISSNIDNEESGTHVYRVRKLMDYKGNEYIQTIESGSIAGQFTYGSWTKLANANDINALTAGDVGALPITGYAGSGEIKSYNRYAIGGNTNGATRYYKIATLPISNSANYASLIITGRIGGMEADNMSSVNAFVFNRYGEGILAIDLANTNSATAYAYCDIVCYRETDGTVSVYLKCFGYFVFDINIEAYQSEVILPTSISYITTEPTGTEKTKLSTTTSRLEIYNGEAWVGGNKLAKSSDVLPITGGTMTGQLIIAGTAGSKPLVTRGIVGSNGNGNLGELYLGYESTYPTKIGQNAQCVIDKDGNISTSGLITTSSPIKMNDDFSIGNSNNIRYKDYNVFAVSGDYVYVGNRDGGFPLVLRGSQTRPTYNDKALALLEDISTDGLVDDTSNQTIGGVKTFSQTIQGNISGKSGSSSLLAESDKRETNENPSYYMNLGVGIINEFKRCTTIGLSESNYCQLETHIMWSDNSGGLPVQIAHLPNNNTYRRYGTSDTTWSSWMRIATSSDLNAYLPLSGGTIVGTSGYTPLNVQSKATNSYIGFKNTNGSTLGYLGVNASSKPCFYGASEQELALKSDIKGGGFTKLWSGSSTAKSLISTLYSYVTSYTLVLARVSYVENLNYCYGYVIGTWCRGSYDDNAFFSGTLFGSNGTVKTVGFEIYYGSLWQDGTNVTITEIYGLI